MELNIEVVLKSGSLYEHSIRFTTAEEGRNLIDSLLSAVGHDLAGGMFVLKPFAAYAWSDISGIRVLPIGAEAEAAVEAIEKTYGIPQG